MVRTERGFLAELWDKYRQDDVSILVSSLAYYTFFSLFPLLLLLESVIGYLFGLGAEFSSLQHQVMDLLPFSSGFLSGAIEKIIRARRSLGLFGSALLLWSATAAFDIVQQILNRIHRAPAMRPLWRRRLLGILLVMIFMLFMPLSIGVAGLRPVLMQALARHPTVPAAWDTAILSLCTGAIGTLFNFLLFLTLYLFGPSVRRSMAQIWVGALAGAVLWEISKGLFGVYIRSLSTYKMLYGSIGSIIAILLWLYVSGTLFALGAEINFVLAVRRERRSPGKTVEPQGAP